MPKMTKRQRECKRISQKKAAKKRWASIIHRVTIMAWLVIALSAGSGAWWFWQSGQFGRLVDTAANTTWKKTIAWGFEVRNIYLAGRRETSLADINAAVALAPGDPILAASPSAIRERLEALPRVKYARVERTLPDTLHIQIVERTPIAVWQHDKSFQLIDDEGVVISGEKVESYRKLPLVVGEDAPAHTPELLALLASEPELMTQMKAAIRVGERRWNIRFGGEMEVKLPEENPAQAWHFLAELQREEKVLDKNILSIDLRAPGQTYIKMPPEALPAPAGKARET